MARKKKWMQSSVKRPGAFRRWCSTHGFGNKVTNRCIQAGLKSRSTRVRRMANLARTFRKYRNRRKGR